MRDHETLIEMIQSLGVAGVLTLLAEVVDPGAPSDQIALNEELAYDGSYLNAEERDLIAAQIRNLIANL